MFDAAAEVGVAAFLAGESPPDDAAVAADLHRGGVEPWLAARLLRFLPLAFGRRLLAGVELSPDFVDERGRHRLADDPVFGWLAARAERADRAEIERIGLRGPELDAVNRALNAGSRLEDLSVGPPALAEPLPAPSGDGGVPSPRAVFGTLLAGHGFPVVDGAVGGLGIDARLFVHPSPVGVRMVQVDFGVRRPDLAVPWLVESFAGLGSTWREAIGDAVAKFERSVLHPLVAGLLDRGACADQVDWQTWAHPTGAFDVCLGPQLVLYSDAGPPPPGPVLERLRRALDEVPLTRAVHALRIFTCHAGGAPVTNEVLLDGEPWPAGEAATLAHPGPSTPDRIGTRRFALLVPR